MRRTKKNFSLGVLACGVFALGALGVYSLDGTKNVRANAEALIDTASFQVSTLGELSWGAVENASGYEWWYTIGSSASTTYTTESNRVDVGIALTKAMQEAVAQNNANTDTSDDVGASVVFYVKPVGVENATASEYSHSFSRYIDYGYATHDLSSIKAQATKPTKISELSLDGCYEGWLSSAMFKNDILTMGMRVDSELDENGLDFALFGTYKKNTALSSYNYTLTQYMDGSVSVAVKGAEYTSVTPDINEYTALTVGENYYLSMAVFDEYDNTGAKIGERVYYARSVYDESTDELVKDGEYSLFVDSTTVVDLNYQTTPNKVYDNTSVVYMEVDVSGICLNTNGFNGTTYVFSGEPTEYNALEAPTGVYYDNTDATLRWNKVFGATQYEWKAGDGAWSTPSKFRKADLTSLIDDGEYKSLGYIPLSVRAVGGKTTTCRLDLTRFYKERSTVVDYIDACKTGKKVKSEVKWPTSLDGSYAPSGYTYKNVGALKNSDGETIFGTHVTAKIKVSAQASATTRIYRLGLYGSTEQTSITSSYNRYFMALYGDGTVQVAAAVSNWSATAGRTEKSSYWRIQNVVDKFSIGNVYYVTYGVDKVYEYDAERGEDVFVAYRASAKIEIQENGGLERRLLGIVSYDHERFDEDGTETGTKKYKIAENPVIYGTNASSYTTVHRAIGDTNHTITFTSAGETAPLATFENVDFGSEYDFSSVPTPTVIPDGYDSFKGWVYQDAKGKEREFLLTGRYNVAIANALEVKADFVPTEYTVSFDVASDNANTYTIESSDELLAPTQTPTGKVFDGWYEASDTVYANSITSLQGMTGNKALVARFIDKYTLTIQAGDSSTEYGYKQYGTEEFALTAPEIDGKTFVGWQVFSGSDFVDYDGETTFVPTASQTFKAVYEWTNYTITYVVDANVTHTNAQNYTAETLVTFNDAEKPNTFFVGWYLDEDYLIKLTNTTGQASNLTLYARFIEHGLSASVVNVNRSQMERAFPAPQLPLGGTYTVKLFKGSAECATANNRYAFDENGDYTLEYSIVLGTGETFEYIVRYKVSGGYVVRIHYGEGQTYNLAKEAGEKLTNEDLAEIEKDGKYTVTGVYLDSEYTTAYDLNTTIANDIVVYVKRKAVATNDIAEEPTNTDTTTPTTEESSNRTVVIVLGALGGIALGGAVAFVYAIASKRKD